MTNNNQTQSTANSGKKTKGGTKSYLTPIASNSSDDNSFSPGPMDVICAKGKQAREHSGNVRFRKIIDQMSVEYGNTANRAQKTALVGKIVDYVKDANGSFVKFEGGQWYEVGDAMAREKVGQSLRERNHSMYRSSTKSKRKMKRDINKKMNDKLSTVVSTNNAVAAGLHQLSNTLEKIGKQTRESDDESLSSSSDETDTELEIAMTSANSQILASLKTDASIQNMLHKDESETNLQ